MKAKPRLSEVNPEPMQRDPASLAPLPQPFQQLGAPEIFVVHGSAGGNALVRIVEEHFLAAGR